MLTSYPDLSSSIAAVTWTWTCQAGQVCPGEIDAFLDDHYGTAPEDVPFDGAFDEGRLGR